MVGPRTFPYPATVPRRPAPAIILFLLAAAALLTLRLALGAATDDLGRRHLTLAFDPRFLPFRADRALLAAAVGSSLALGGVFLQALLRNPLASPDLIGASAGATLAVTIATALSSAALATRASIGFWQGPAATAGSLATLALVYALARRRGIIEPVSLILIGVIISISAGAAALLITHTLPDQGYSISRWTLGSLNEDAPHSLAVAVLGLVAIAFAAALALGPDIDAASLSDDEARSIGVNLPRLRLILFALSGLLTAGAVILAGPIGFVGLVCPHLARLTAGPRTRPLALAAAPAGIALIAAADCATTAIDLGSGRLPIGIFTALVGGPALIYLLRRSTTPTL
jgi:iron complex transport system permease protein